MDRNLESRFSTNPVDLDVQRSRFDRDFGHKFSGSVSQLIPWFVDEVLPGDSYEMTTSKVIRFPSFMRPVMDNLYLDTYYFFVPMRLVWDHAKEFFGENTASAWYPQVEYSIPQISFDGNGTVASKNEKAGTTTTYFGSDVGSIADYMGACPPIKVVSESKADPPAFEYSCSVLPIRAYNKVYEDWFRSEAIQDPVNLYTGDSTVSYDKDSPLTGGYPYLACKYFDYFTSCLPNAQRGPAVTFNLADSASITIPSVKMNVNGDTSVHTMSNGLRFGTSNGTTSTISALVPQTTPVSGIDAGIDGAVVLGNTGSTGGQILPADWEFSLINKNNLVVTYPGASSIPIGGVNSISVNELRMAFQLQKWYERSAMYGGRYVSMLKGQFGVTSPDATLQRSEYLGGNRVPISITQVENTAGESTPLGTLGAYSATSDVHQDFFKSFTEHGFIIGVSVVRYRHTYSQGVERMWSRKAMTDYYFPVFANLGNQAVKNKEIYISGVKADDEAVFGYQEAWADYRYKPDRVSGEMRPGVDNSLASWHFADYYTQTPSLSPEWLVEDPVPVDRTLAVAHDVSNQFFADFYCDLKVTRAMPLYSIPGLIDHH